MGPASSGGPALRGVGRLVAVTVALAVVAVVTMLVLAAAAVWTAVVLIWLVCCGLRRRLALGPVARHSVRARHAHRAVR